MNRPCLFLSAVSGELGTARRFAAEVFHRLGFDTISQDDFPTGYGELRAWLRKEIDSCEGLVQVVGEAYGAEPPEPDPTYGRVSYTQYELLYAQAKARKIWVIRAGDQFPRDTPLDQLDLPFEPDHPDPTGYQVEKRRLQGEYLARLKKDNYLLHEAESKAALEILLLRLPDELENLRRRTEKQQTRLVAGVAGLFLLLVALGVGGWWAFHRLQAGVQQAGEVSTEKISAHLRQTAGETHRRELAEADRATDWKQRQRLRDAANAAHTARLGRIDELAASFGEIDGSSGTSDDFHEMTRILTEQGVDGAVTYVAAQRSTILKEVKSRNVAAQERNRADLQPLLQAAALYENKGQPAEARALYDDILDAEPDWSAALHAAFQFFVNQGDAATVRTTLADAREQYAGAQRLAGRLVSTAPDNAQWQRDLAVSHSKLGDVAMAQGRLDEAARAYGDCLAIRQRLAEGSPNSVDSQRDLYVSYTKLGELAVARGRLAEAAQRYSDGLALARKLADRTPGNLESQRDLFVSHTKCGEVAAAQGRLDEALRAYGEALVIARKLAAGDPGNTAAQRDLAVSHNKLGDLALTRGRLDEAARAYNDGLAIARTLTQRDPGNTEFQRDLSVSFEKLGDVALEQGRLDDAAEAYTDGLAIRRKLAASDSANAEWQRDLSISHEKLGGVAEARGQLADAAKAYAEALAIRKALASDDPGNAQWQRDLSVSHDRLGDVAVATGRLDEAARNYDEGLAIAEKLAADDPSNAEWQRDLLISIEKVGDVAMARGRLDAAARAYARRHAIATKLAAEEPGSAEAQRDLSISCEKLGDVAVALGRLDDAARAYGESLAISRRLAEAEAGNGQWQRDLYVVSWKLGDLAERTNNPGDARGFRKQALEALSGLEKRGLHLSAEDRKSLARLRQQVGAGH